MVENIESCEKRVDETEKVVSKKGENEDREPIFEEGDRVLKRNEYESEPDRSTKFNERWVGPFVVTDNKSRLTPKLRDEHGVEDYVHVSKLKKFREQPAMVGKTRAELEERRKKITRRAIPQESADFEDADESYEPPKERVEPVTRTSTRARKRVHREDCFSSEWLDV